MKSLKDEYLSAEHYLLALAESHSPASRLLEAGRRDPCEDFAGAAAGEGVAARDRSESRGQIPDAGEIWARSDRGGAAREDRPRDRARQRDPPRHAGALPPHEKQPRADRRSRRGQDGDRRGAGAAHRQRRRAGIAQGQEDRRHGYRLDDGGSEVPRRIRGSAQGLPQGGDRFARAGHPLHRRAAHHRRRGRGGRARWMPRTC